MSPYWRMLGLIAVLVLGTFSSALAQVNCRSWEPCFVSPASYVQNAYDASGRLIPSTQARVIPGDGRDQEIIENETSAESLARLLTQMPDAGIAGQLNAGGLTLNIGAGMRSGVTTNMGVTNIGIGGSASLTNNVSGMNHGYGVTINDVLAVTIAPQTIGVGLGFGFSYNPGGIPISGSYSSDFGTEAPAPSSPLR